LVDIALTLAALHLASWARFLIPWGRQLAWRFAALPWPVYLITALVWPAALLLSSAYEPRMGRRRFFDQVRTLVLGVGLGLLVLAGTLYLSYRSVPRRLFLYFGVLDLVFLLLTRVAFHQARRLIRRNGGGSRLLIAGAGPIGAEIARQVQAFAADWQLVGLLDDNAAKVGTDVSGARVLGTLDALEETIRTESVDEVIFALPLRAHERLMGLVLRLEEVPVEVNVVPDYFDLAFYRTRTDDLFGFPLVRLRASAIEGRVRVAKRLFDLALAIPLLILCAPLLPLVALVIRLDSPGPVLFRQERVGENCRRFRIWKLRTMVPNAEELLPEIMLETPDGQVVYKRPDDPRITRVGRFLRRYSLDELPQLVNVIRGEMSLVGPRPELPWMVERYQGWERKRFAVPPGITGWWQVSGRSDRGTHVRVEDDLYYIQNYSIWLDVRILWRTIGAVLSGRGAY
jgi:exopolysaccharide biosynthesis polyprenyl glycosylphosphotransferase